MPPSLPTALPPLAPGGPAGSTNAKRTSGQNNIPSFLQTSTLFLRPPSISHVCSLIIIVYFSLSPFNWFPLCEKSFEVGALTAPPSMKIQDPSWSPSVLSVPTWGSALGRPGGGCSFSLSEMYLDTPGSRAALPKLQCAHKSLGILLKSRS